MPVHKSFIGKAIGGAVKRLIPAVGIASDVVSFAGRAFSKRPARATVPRASTARTTIFSAEEKQLGRRLKFPDAVPLTIGGGGPPPRTGPGDFDIRPKKRPLTGGGGGGPCDYPKVLDKKGFCRMPTSGEFGGEQFGVGAAVMGQFGAALEPGSMIIERSVCLPGMQLAKDGLCYNKGAITNSQRMWPRGRRPLLTGGDMRAIGIAARAGAKLDRTTKRLRALGMMKKLPAGRGARPHAHAKPVAAVSVT